MSTTAPKTKPSPLRGLAVGVVLMLLLFPAVLRMLTGAVEVVLGVAAGLLLVGVIYSFTGARRR